MKDLLELIKEWINSVSERLKIPFLNSLIISWIIINWKIVLIILLSDTDIEARINLISSQYSSYWYIYILPLTAATLYTFGTPFLLKLSHLALVKIKRKNWEDQADFKIYSFDKKIIIAERQRDLQIKRAEYMELDELNSKREALEAELTNKNEELAQSSKHISELNSRIKENQRSIGTTINLKNRAYEYYAELLSEIRNGISFQKQEEIDGFQLLNFVHRLLLQLHQERGKFEEDRNYLIPLEVRDQASGIGFGELIKEIKNENYTLEGVLSEKIEFAMRNDLIFSFEKKNNQFYGLTYKGLGFAK